MVEPLMFGVIIVINWGIVPPAILKSQDKLDSVAYVGAPLNIVSLSTCLN